MADREWSRPVVSQLSQLVSRGSRGERQVPAGDDGGVLVPWQALVVDDPQRVTVHYFTLAFNEFVGLETVEGPDEVRLTVHERTVSWEQSGEHRSASVVLQAPLAERRLVDGATGGERKVFSPDPRAGWMTFDHAVAEHLVHGSGRDALSHAARTALANGCEGTPLDRLAAGSGELVAVYRERGVPPLDDRRAARLLVDAALRRALRGGGEAEQVGPMLRRIVESGHLSRDERELVAPLIRLAAEIRARLDAVGDAEKEFARFEALARDVHERGGFGAG